MSHRKPQITCRMHKVLPKAKKLIQLGFSFETGEYNDGGKLFRKIRETSDIYKETMGN